MKRPPSLVGQSVGGARIVADWELRITGRCLSDDLNASSDADFRDVEGLQIVKAFIRERAARTEGTRDVNGLRCGQTAWVLAHGNDHRGATIHDPEHEVVWLVAYARHRSGESDDFFPYCRGLDAADRLLPTEKDYKRLIEDRDRRFVEAVTLEAPLILRYGRENPGEHKHRLGGDMAAGIAVEVEPGVEAITIAFRLDAIDWDAVPILCAAFYSGTPWDHATKMPSRELEPGEVAMEVVKEPEQPSSS